MGQTGSERIYTTPPLPPSREYVYEIRARWRENGREADWTRRVRLHSGDRQTIDFLPQSADERSTTGPQSAEASTLLPRPVPAQPRTPVQGAAPSAYSPK
jgi:uncharacterized protein (TIGR03000 family)